MITTRGARHLRRRPHVLVAGLGNELRSDDGVGLHVVRQLSAAELLPSQTNLQVVEVGTAVLDATHLWEWADRILVLDAMHGEGAPGSVYITHLDNVEPGQARHGLHGLHLSDALSLCVDRRWEDVLLMGIEPLCLDLGTKLSPAVEAAVPEAARLVSELVEAWLGR
jgi:hydrogenase maturation protease